MTKFKQAYALAYAIPRRKNKRAVVKTWCKTIKQALKQ